MKAFYGDRYIARQKARKVLGQLSIQWLYAPEVGQILNLCHYRGLLGEVGVVVAEDPKGDLKLLEDEGVVLIFEEAPKGIDAERCYPPSKFEDFCDYVEAMFKQRGKRVEQLSQLVGWWGSASLEEMEGEVEVICAFVGEEGDISIQDLVKFGYVPSIGETGEYDLLNGFGSSKVDLALSGLRSYHSAEDWFRARNKLLGHLMTLVRVASLQGTDVEMAKAVGVNPYVFKKNQYCEQAERFGKRKLLSWIGRLQGLQVEFRLNPEDIKAEMERVLIEGLRGGGGGRETVA